MKAGALTALVMISLAWCGQAVVRAQLAQGAKSAQKRAGIWQTHAGARLAAFLRIVNSKDHEQIKQFVKDAYIPGTNSSVVSEQREAQLRALAIDRAPLTLLDIVDSRPDRVTVRVRDRVGITVGVRIDVEGAKPYRIKTLRIGQVD